MVTFRKSFDSSVCELSFGRFCRDVGMTAVARKVPKWLLTVCPELRYFETDELRWRALNAAEAPWHRRRRFKPRRMSVASWDFLVFLAYLGGANAFFRFVFQSLGTSKYDWVLQALFLVFLLGAILYYRYWKYATTVRRRLRWQLLREGVPICTECGYDLRGRTTDRCSECGHELGANVEYLRAKEFRKDFEEKSETQDTQ